MRIIKAILLIVLFVVSIYINFTNYLISQQNIETWNNLAIPSGTKLDPIAVQPLGRAIIHEWKSSLPAQRETFRSETSQAILVVSPTCPHSPAALQWWAEIEEELDEHNVRTLVLITKNSSRLATIVPERLSSPVHVLASPKNTTKLLGISPQLILATGEGLVKDAWIPLWDQPTALELVRRVAREGDSQ